MMGFLMAGWVVLWCAYGEKKKELEYLFWIGLMFAPCE